MLNEIRMKKMPLSNFEHMQYVARKFDQGSELCGIQKEKKKNTKKKHDNN